MTSLVWLIPAALALGGLGLAAFLWSLKSGQYDDLEGAAWRALEDRPPQMGEENRDQIKSAETAAPATQRSNKSDGARRLS